MIEFILTFKMYGQFIKMCADGFRSGKFVTKAKKKSTRRRVNE